MTEIELVTSPDHAFVATVRIPPFQTLPDVLFWGQRVFVQLDAASSPPRYREAFAVAAPVEPEQTR